MMDFHAHIIPGIDDGARNTSVSFDMLTMCLADGVNTVLATSHFYPKGEESLNIFLERRSNRLIHLEHESKRNKIEIPTILKAAEVSLTDDITEYPLYEKLCIENTNYMIIEMPYTNWDESVFDIIYSLKVKGIKPIIAHIERYKNKKSDFESLFELNPLCQINADLFFTSSGRLRAAALIKNGHAHFVGSDMHNMTSRIPNIASAYKIIAERFGDEYVSFFKENAKKAIANEDIDRCGATRLNKPSKIKLIF